MNSPDTKNLCLQIVDIHYSDTPLPPHADRCEGSNKSEEKLIRNMDGYFKEDFPEAHQGLTPDELKIVGRTFAIEGSSESIELFFTPSKPAFRLESSIANASVLLTDHAPEPVYSQQALHTHQYRAAELSRPTSIKASVECPYLTKAALNKAIREAVANKHRGVKPENRGNAAPSAPSVSLVSPVVIAPNPSPFVFRPAPKLAPLVRPQASRPAVDAARQVHFKRVKLEDAAAERPTCAKSGVAPTPPFLSKKSVEKSQSVQPLGAPLPPPAPAPLRSSAGPPTPAATRPASTPPGPMVAKRPRLDGSQKSSVAKDLSGGLKNVQAVDLAKVKPDDQESSADGITEADTRGMNKFGKALANTSLVKILMGINLEPQVVQLRKAKKLAERESPEDWHPKLNEHLAKAVGCQQLVMFKLMMLKSFEQAIALAEAVVDALPSERLTKFSFADLYLLSVAMQTLPPWQPSPDLMRFLELIELSGELNKDYDLRNPTWLCDLYDTDDLQTGVIPSRFSNFVERYILNAYIAAGQKNQELLVKFIHEGLVPKLAKLPSDYSAPCYGALKQRSCGVLTLIGPIPYMSGNTAADAKVFRDDPKNIVSQAVAGTKWTATLLDCVNMQNAGERIAWPQVEEFVKTLRDAGPEGAISHIEEMVPKYNVWKKQCRPTALPHELHPVVLASLLVLLESKRRKAGDEIVTYDTNDPVVVKVLSILTDLRSLGWTESLLAEAIVSLGGVSAAVLARSATTRVLDIFEQFDCSSVQQPGEIEKFSASIVPAIPADKNSKVSIPVSNRDAILQKLVFVGKMSLDSWPKQALYEVATFLLTRLEIPEDPPFENENGSAMLKEYKSNFTSFRRLQGWWKHLELWKQRGHISAQLVEDPSVIELAKKLIVYYEFFSSAQFSADVLQAGPKQTSDIALQDTATAVTKFKSMYVGNVEAPFRKAVAELKKGHGGAPNGAMWFQSVSEGVSWLEFFQATENNLRKAQKVELITAVRTADSVRLRRTG